MIDFRELLEETDIRDTSNETHVRVYLPIIPTKQTTR